MCLISDVCLSAEPKKIPETMAQELAALAVEGSDEGRKYYEPCGGCTENGPPFYAYEGIGPYGGTFGWFGVNPWTGKVWDLWSCKELSKPASSRLRAEIKQKNLGLS